MPGGWKLPGMSAPLPQATVACTITAVVNHASTTLPRARQPIDRPSNVDAESHSLEADGDRVHDLGSTGFPHPTLAM